ncbi:MAG: zinc ribbon domain-containing protein [Rhodomicrobium sp.]
MIKCPICGAELAPGTPICPICGASLAFSIRPVIAGLIHLTLAALVLYFIPSPYSYAACLPFAILSLLAFGAGGLGVYRSIQRARS